MPARNLPTFLLSEVQEKKGADCCYVTLGTNVYDVTPFLEDHPGGDDLILQYGGKDVTEIMEDMVSHMHTEVAYEIMEEYLVGFVATEEVMDVVKESSQPDAILPLPPTKDGLKELKKEGVEVGKLGDLSTPTRPIYATTGMSDESDLSKETDVANDYKQHKFLDLSKPLLMQVWNGGFSKDFYLQQVHRPRHYKGGDSAPLFGNFLEPLSLTPWWVVPSIWLPCIAYGSFQAYQGLRGGPWELTAYWALGLGLWTLIEYTLHRCLFHIDNHLPDNRVFITLHFLLHGVHHYLPMDRYRLVMPPALFVILATPFWYLVHAVFSYSWYAATAVYCGGIFGYVCYDLTHYFLHHKT